MAPVNPHSERFDELFAIASENRLTDEEYAEWNALLQNDQEMRREYLRRAYFRSTLCRRFREDADELEQSPSPAASIDETAKQRSLSNPRIWRAAAVVVVAIGLFFVLAYFRGGPAAPAHMANSSAVVTGLVNVLWEDPNFKLPVSSFVPAQRLRLHAGLVRIESPRGVVVVIQGPAQFQVDSHCNLTLEHGSVAANVPPAGVGFSVVTPNATVTDLGTEFGVYVNREDQTHAEVFVGKVRVATNARSSKSQILEAGHAVQVPNESTGIQPAATEPLAFVRPVEFAEVVRSDAEPPLARWLAFNHHVQGDAGLLAYYDFEPDSTAGAKLANVAAITRGQLDGTCSDTQWDVGRMTGKHALRFTGQSRVDVNIPQSMNSLTLVAWINPQNLAQQRRTFTTTERRGVFSGMLMTNGARAGAVHWQLVDGMRAELGIGIAPSPRVPFSRYRSLDALSSQDDGRWMMMAVVIDPSEKKVRHYLDGALFGRNVLNPESGSFQIGEAEIGNWLPLDRPDHRSRGFVGRIDELAIFNRVLSEQEIQSIYAAGSGG